MPGEGATTVLAVDLGAESGRVMAVEAARGELRLRELHRFANRPVEVRGTLHWDILALWANVQHGIEAGLELRPASLAIDSWAVDFGLLDASGALLGNPVHYRDRRTDGAVERMTAAIGRERIFEATGIQFMPINTLTQLFAMREQDAPALKHARRFLMIPDLLNYWLTGEQACEFTNATTTQLYDPRARSWSRPLLDALDLDPALFPDVRDPGTFLGTYRGVDVVAPATHDTGSAVAAMPATSAEAAFISSGTWSLVGTVVDAPVIDAAALAANVTNEGAADGRFRLLKNVMGLWILQECRRAWERQGEAMTYDAIVEMAAKEPALRSVIPVDDARFLPPGDHPSVVRELCRERGEPVPETPAAVARCVFDSLALAYRHVLETLSGLTGRSFGAVHVLGGGSRNALLNQATANACACTVVAGPAEATVLGNALVQLRSLGVAADLDEGRRWIAGSSEQRTYEPRDVEAWEHAYARLADARGEGSLR